MKAEKMQRQEGHRDIFKKTEGEEEEGMKKTQNEGMNNRRKLKPNQKPKPNRDVINQMLVI